MDPALLPGYLFTNTIGYTNDCTKKNHDLFALKYTAVINCNRQAPLVYLQIVLLSKSQKKLLIWSKTLINRNFIPISIFMCLVSAHAQTLNEYSDTNYF